MAGADYRTRNQDFFAKIEATSGEEETLAAVDAVKVVVPIPTAINIESEELDESTGGLDQSAPETGGGYVGFKPSVFLRGAGTAGQAPDYGKLLRGCGLQEILTAAAVTGTAQAGAAGSITLAATASAVDDAYQGMVITTTGGTGTGQTRVITAYNGTTKVASITPDWTTAPDATTTYSIPANALYVPAHVGLETLTMAKVLHASNPANGSKRLRGIGCAGKYSLAVTTRKAGNKLDFDFRGILPGARDEVARPASTLSTVNARPFLSAMAYLGGQKVKFGDFSFDQAGTIEQDDDPAAALGYDIGEVMKRVGAGTITPSMSLNSTRNAMQDWMDARDQPLWLYWGPRAGERVSLFFPGIRFTGNEDQDKRGFAAERLPFRAEAGCILCIL